MGKVKNRQMLLQVGDTASRRIVLDVCERTLEKLDAYKKVRGMKPAKKNMLEAMKKDLDTRFADYVKKGEMKLHIAYTSSREEAEAWTEEVRAAFPDLPISSVDTLSLSVICHTGPGVLAIAASHCLDNE